MATSGWSGSFMQFSSVYHVMRESEGKRAKNFCSIPAAHGLDLAIQPGPSVSPVIFGSARRDAQGLRRFVIGHADEITQLDQLRFDLVLGAEFIQCLA